MTKHFLVFKESGNGFRPEPMSTVTNHKTLIDVTASLDRNYLSFTTEKVY